MPVQLQATILVPDRELPYGAQGVLDGAVVLGGLSAVLGYSRGSGMRKRGERGVASEVEIIPGGYWFAMTDSHFRGPIAKASPVQIQFRASGSVPLTEALTLGPLGKPRLSFCVSTWVPVTVVGEIQTDDRTFGPGSRATIGGKLVFPRGILARCTFRRTDHCGKDGQLLVGSADATAVAIGHEIRFAGRSNLTPAPATPLKSVAFLDGYGHRLRRMGPLLRRGPTSKCV